MCLHIIITMGIYNNKTDLNLGKLIFPCEFASEFPIPGLGSPIKQQVAFQGKNDAIYSLLKCHNIYI